MIKPSTQQRDKLFSLYGEPETFDDLAYLLMGVINNNLPNNELIGFSWVMEQNKISTTGEWDRCPLNYNLSKVSNYPIFHDGFYGRVWFNTLNDVPFGKRQIYLGDSMSSACVYTTSLGSGTHYGPWRVEHNGKKLYGGNFFFFIKDFPKLEEHFRAEMVLLKLKGSSNNVIHNFFWEMP